LKHLQDYLITAISCSIQQVSCIHVTIKRGLHCRTGGIYYMVRKENYQDFFFNLGNIFFTQKKIKKKRLKKIITWNIIKSILMVWNVRLIQDCFKNWVIIFASFFFSRTSWCSLQGYKNESYCQVIKYIEFVLVHDLTSTLSKSTHKRARTRLNNSVGILFGDEIYELETMAILMW
jgi:hypothetical protein